MTILLKQHEQLHPKINYILLLLIITFFLVTTSSLSYFEIRKVFWLAEIPPYVFCFLAGATLIATLFFKKKSNRFTIIDLLVLLYFAYNIISLYIRSIPASDRIYELGGILMFYVWIRIIGVNFKDQTIFFHAILLSTFLQACWGLLQKIEIVPYSTLMPGVQGGFINSGLYGCFVSIGVMTTIYLLIIFKSTNLKIIIYSFICLIILSALILSKSRTAYLSALVGIFIFLYQISSKWRTSLKVRYKYSLYFLSTSVLVTLAFWLWQMNTLSVTGRLLIWKISLTAWLDEPFFGIGYGNFFSQYGNYQADYFSHNLSSTSEINVAGMNYYAFNELLKILVESGLFGLLIFVTLLLTVLLKGKLLSERHHTNTWMLLSILIAIVLFGLFSYPFASPAINILFYSPIAILAANSRLIFKFRLTAFVKMGVFFIVAIPTLASCRKIIAIHTWGKAQKNIYLAEGDALRKYQKIYPTLSENGAFLFNHGTFLTNLGLYSKSLHILHRAEHYGNSVVLKTHIANAYFGLKKYRSAEKYYLLATYMDPKLFSPLDDLLTFYINTKQLTKATEIAKKIKEKPVKIPSKKVQQFKKRALLFLNEAPRLTKTKTDFY